MPAGRRLLPQERGGQGPEGSQPPEHAERGERQRGDQEARGPGPGDRDEPQRAGKRGQGEMEMALAGAVGAPAHEDHPDGRHRVGHRGDDAHLEVAEVTAGLHQLRKPEGKSVEGDH